MTRRKDEKYCAQHILEIKDSVGGRKRVPCPLDKGHTVWADQVDHHITKCRARKVVPTDPWYIEDYNVADTTTDKPKSADIDYKRWIQALEQMMTELNEPASEIKTDAGLDSRLQELENQKHAVQQASLIGHMRDAGLLSLDNVICEFGCGRAELSRYVARSRHTITGNRGQRFLLIDRASQRLKLDTKIVKDYNEAKPNQEEPCVQRIKIDIKDLALNHVPFVQDEHIAVISKHLCGCATDLTLSCIAKSDVDCQGMVIALCCRHACQYDMYNPVGQQWLAKYGIDQEGFQALTKMAPWAVCGPGRAPASGQVNAGGHASGLDANEREQVGLMARRAIDHGRVLYLQSLGYKARIVEYIGRDSTLENHCLVVTKEPTQI